MIAIPPKRIRSLWNQDCLVTAAKLMSLDPSWPAGAHRIQMILAFLAIEFMAADAVANYTCGIR
jgi:hypothetical protein